MGTQGSMFPLEGFEPGNPHLPDEETHYSDEGVPEGGRSGGGHAGIGAERQEDSLETTVNPEQGADVPEEAPFHIVEQAKGGQPDSIYERTGLKGPFEPGPLALIFPDIPVEDLADDIRANGLLEDITVAGIPLAIIDGKRRHKACLAAGVSPKYRLLRRDMDPKAYVWARNGERRNLTKSQKALAFAGLFPNWTPGRPPKHGENSSALNSFPGATQGEAAKSGGISRTLVSGAVKLVKEGTPELTEAVKQDVITLSDALKREVIGAPREVHQQALALVRDGAARTAAAAVARVLEGHSEEGSEGISEANPPTRFGENAMFHVCSVTDLGKHVPPGTVDLIVACPPTDARPAIFSDLGALATCVLTETGVMVVALEDTGRLPEVLSRLRKEVPEWIIELSLLFPSPIGDSGEPHWIDRRRVALLVFGRPMARLTVSEDVIEVPYPGIDGDGGPPGIEDGLALLLERFSSHGQVVCDPMIQGKTGVVSAALDLGCAFVGADEDQSLIDLVLERLTGAVAKVEGQKESVQ